LRDGPKKRKVEFGRFTAYRTRKGGNCDALQLETTIVVPDVLSFNYETRNAPMYQVSAKSVDPRLRYCDSTISNLGAVAISSLSLSGFEQFRGL